MRYKYRIENSGVGDIMQIMREIMQKKKKLYGASLKKMKQVNS